MYMKFKDKILFSLGTASAVAGAAAIVSGIADNIDIPDNFTLTAHTGCEGTKMNSLNSITVGYVSGANIVEFDLYFNSDGKAVLSHGEPQGGEVTIDEAFAHIKQFKSLKVNVDVKRTDDLKQVAECAEKHGILDRIFYTGINIGDVEAVLSSTPDVPYYLNVSVDEKKKNDAAYIDGLIEEVKASGAVGINMQYKSCSKLLVEKLRKSGLLVSVWTVNNRFDMKKVLSYGADNITTQKPSQYKELISDLTGEIHG